MFKYLEIDIIEMIDNAFPFWVKCHLLDASGNSFYFEEKLPIVSFEDITFDIVLPQKGYIAGEIISVEGKIICFSTKVPWGIESLDGKDIFYVYKQQIVDM